MYHDHPWDPKIVAVVDRWSLFRGSFVLLMMQTEIALSTTEAEYIALSQAMREVLPIIWLMKKGRGNKEYQS